MSMFFFYVESIKCTQDNFKIIEDVANVDQLHRYIPTL
jgi:hypothetical protein